MAEIDFHNPAHYDTLRPEAAFEALVENLRANHPDAFALIDLNGRLEQLDLQAEYRQGLEAQRDTLLRQQEAAIAEKLEHPLESTSEIVEVLSALYSDRTIETVQHGTQVREFITRDLRDSQKTGIDLHFRDLTYPDGNHETVIEVPMRNFGSHGDGLPFYVVLNDDEMYIEQKFYRRGEYRYATYTADTDPVNYQDRLRRFFGFSYVATDVLSTRQPDAVEKANHEALELLRHKNA